MSVINYIDPFMGNSSTFAPKENYNHITPWEHMLQKVNSKNEMEKAAYFGWLPFNLIIGWQHSSSSLPKYGTYTNEKSLSHCRDQGSS